MRTVTFWGGPKDGEVLEQNTEIEQELFCTSNESMLMDSIEFDEIKNFPNRSQKYCKYILDYIDEKVAKYKFSGVE